MSAQETKLFLRPWMKAGTWITFSVVRKIVPLKIVKIDYPYGVTLLDPVEGTISKRCVQDVYNACPIRFDPYPEEYAPKLLGKRIVIEERNNNNTVYTSAIISRVFVSATTKKVNLFHTEPYISHSLLLRATIDGLPMGIPAIDYETLDKEDNNERTTDT